MTDLAQALHLIDTLKIPDYFSYMKTKVGENVELNILEKKFIHGKTDENFYDQLKVLTQRLLPQTFSLKHGELAFQSSTQTMLLDTLSKWYASQTQKELNVLVLCSTTQEISQVAELQSIQSYFGTLPENWQPYTNTAKNIAELLQEYHQKTNIPLKGWFLNGFDWADEDFLDDLRDKFSKNIILITDGIALLKPENQSLKKVFVEQEKIGGFMLPLCNEHDLVVKSYIRQKIEQELKTTYRRFTKSWKTAYFHIELEIPNKDLFFRRLTNLASLIGVKSSSSVADFEKTKNDKKGLDNLQND